jgi:hypothetical protein
MFASERGVISLKSTDKAIESEFGYLSQPISRTYNEQLDRVAMKTQASSIYDERENLYMLSVPSLGQAVNDSVLVYNTETGAWSTFSNMQARTMAKVQVSGQPRVVAGREDGRLVLTDEEARSDIDGTAFTGFFRSGIYYPGGQTDTEHMFYSITIMGSTNTTNDVIVQYFIDGKVAGSRTVNFKSEGDLLGSSFVLGSSTLTTSLFVPRTIKIKGRGRGMQISVSIGGTTDTEIYGFIVESQPADYDYS